MPYPDDLNGDVFRRMEESGFNFSKEHIVDFHAVFATKSEADQIAKMYVADFKAGEQLTNIETRPILEFETRLQRRVSQVEGYLDGWGVLQE